MKNMTIKQFLTILPLFSKAPSTKYAILEHVLNGTAMDDLRNLTAKEYAKVIERHKDVELDYSTPPEGWQAPTEIEGWHLRTDIESMTMGQFADIEAVCMNKEPYEQMMSILPCILHKSKDAPYSPDWLKNADAVEALPAQPTYKVLVSFFLRLPELRSLFLASGNSQTQEKTAK